ncbi:MAG: hypothetical protein IJ142_03180 [Bacteroidaceae bacterium]|nr:hypothetical protein [Bacteroidaceae bacterium]
MRKFYSLFIALLAVCGLAKAQVTFDIASNPWGLPLGSGQGETAEAGNVTQIVQDGVTLNLALDAESGTPPRMWTGNQLRIYTNNTIQVSAGDNKITGVVFTYTENNTTASYFTNDVDDQQTTSGIPWTGDVKTITFKSATTKGHFRISKIEVYLNGQTPAPVDPVDPIDWTSSAEKPMDVPTVLERAASLATGENSAKQVYVKGIVSSITYSFDEEHGTATFNISEDGDEGSDQFLCYASYYLGNRSWKEGDKQIQVGDDVIVYGLVTNYNGTFEMASRQNYIYSLNGDVGEEVKVPEYTKIADIKAAATATRTQVVYKAQEVLVTYVNGSSLYVYDGTDGLLLYGKNSGIKTGDKITVDVKGELYLYNGLTEIAVSEYANQTVVSSDNEVTPQKVTIADVTNNYAQYENELVSIVELTPAAAAWDDQRCVSFVDDSDNTIVVRDNFQVAADLAFDTEKAYTVTGFVAVRATEDGSEYRIYPRSVADLDNGVTPEPFVAEGEGTMEKPYTIADVKGILANNLAAETPVWVHGFIVASANGSLDKLIFEGGDEAIPSNVMLAASKDATEKGDMIPVALPTGNVRAALNLKDNAANIGLEVWVYGTIEKYFSVAGVKNVTDFSLDGKTGVSDLNAASADKAIYNLAGQRLQTIGRSGLYIVGGKKMLVK